MEALVLLHQDRVFAVLRRCVPYWEIEDLAQEAFLRAFGGLDRFRGEARFGTWLFQIVRNLLIDRHRSRRRAPDSVGLHEETGSATDVVLEDPAPGPEEAYDGDMLESQLRKALERLDERDRIAILLHDQEGMSAAEVATVVGGSAGALRIRLMRARRKLRGWLREAGVR
jgi:RNA polymerase sigma-70 factor (ECF subfamily)